MAKEIILIFTKHQESGNCNQVALLKIIESVKPEVIFEELSSENYKKVYEDGSLNTLESDAIKDYMKKGEIEHLPVDTYDLPSDYYPRIEFLYGKLTKGIEENSFHFKNLINQRCELEDKYGFQFLNSTEMLKFLERFDAIKNKFLLEKNDEKLNAIALLEKEVIDNREETMLRDIYNYSIENEYTTALFFIGSGHMHTMLPKIKAWCEKEGKIIDWHFYKDLNLC